MSAMHNLTLPSLLLLLLLLLLAVVLVSPEVVVRYHLGFDFLLKDGCETEDHPRRGQYNKCMEEELKKLNDPGYPLDTLEVKAARRSISARAIKLAWQMFKKWIGSRFLRRLRSDLTRSLLILKNELVAT